MLTDTNVFTKMIYSLQHLRGGGNIFNLIASMAGLFSQTITISNKLMKMTIFAVEMAVFGNIFRTVLDSPCLPSEVKNFTV